MFNRKQLEFIKGSLTGSQIAVPVAEARVFVTVLDEIEAQLSKLPPAKPEPEPKPPGG